MENNNYIINNNNDDDNNNNNDNKFDFAKLMQTARSSSNINKLKSIDFRKQQLRNLLRLFNEQEELLIEALNKDLSKPRLEAILSEIDPIKNEIHYSLRNIDEWTKPRLPGKSLITVTDEVFIERIPYGLVLIIGPWNYPSYSTMVPLVGAIAAGNSVILKPSEIASSCSNFFSQMIPRYLDKECFQVVELDGDGTDTLLKERFDYIFFVGSPYVGKIIYKAAAKHLTPVTLELGGKCPVFIDDNLKDIYTATKRILWGKFFNSGQTCIAPDYVLCSSKIYEKFIEQAKIIMQEFYQNDPFNSKDFARIINKRNVKRLEDAFNSTKGKVIFGGKFDMENKYVSPTIVANVTLEDSLMKQEIFGPILPIIICESDDAKINIINSLPNPLVIYVFSEDKNIIERIRSETYSGTILANDTLLHACLNLIPFGGKGNSGIGKFLGKFTFDQFSQDRPCMIRNYQRFGEVAFSSRYPPYNNNKIQLLRDSLDQTFGIIPARIVSVLYRVFVQFFQSFLPSKKY